MSLFVMCISIVFIDFFPPIFTHHYVDVRMKLLQTQSDAVTFWLVNPIVFTDAAWYQVYFNTEIE